MYEMQLVDTLFPPGDVKKALKALEDDRIKKFEEKGLLRTLDPYEGEESDGDSDD